jgi:hypothetical protein
MLILHTDYENDVVLMTWDAHEPSRAETVSLFGTATLPTPFTSRADRSEVIRTIARLNPDSVVMWDESIRAEL